MAINISGNGSSSPREAVETGRSQATTANNSRAQGGGAAKSGTGGADQLKLSSQAAQLQALEAEIASLPVVDVQRVQDVQRTIATQSYEVQPARVADKVLTFEAGLAKAH